MAYNTLLTHQSWIWLGSGLPWLGSAGLGSRLQVGYGAAPSASLRAKQLWGDALLLVDDRGRWGQNKLLSRFKASASIKCVNIYQSKLRCKGWKTCPLSSIKRSCKGHGWTLITGTEWRVESNDTICLIEQRKRHGQRLGVRKELGERPLWLKHPERREES